MSKNRKLAAVLFADIVGYTATMQTDEPQALRNLKKFKSSLESQVAKRQGKIIQFYGDGCLCIFNSSVDAVACARSLQADFLSEPKVPVRIGLHAGEVVFRDDNVFGDAVNIASRVESMGIPGSVLLSSNVRNQIKNQPDFALTNLGKFEFKNVQEGISVYALANEGLAVPKKEEITGKLKPKKVVKESFFQSLWAKRIPQILVTYLLMAWIVLQLFDWALQQFGISPHWAQIFFITVLGIIPSLLVYLNNRERIQKGQLRLGEKILFPSNLALLGMALFFMFRTADLGATSMDVTFTNADGIEVTETVIKAEFKKRFPVFQFDPIEADSATAWLGSAIAMAITEKLAINKHLSPKIYLLPANRINKEEAYTTVEKINFSKVWNQDYYIDGAYQVNGNEFVVTPMIKNKKTGKVIQQ